MSTTQHSHLNKAEREFIERYEMALFLLEDDHLADLAKTESTPEQRSGAFCVVDLEASGTDHLEETLWTSDNRWIRQLKAVPARDLKALFQHAHKTRLSQEDLEELLLTQEAAIEAIEHQLDPKIDQYSVMASDHPQKAWIKAEIVRLQELLNRHQQLFQAANALNAFFPQWATAQSKHGKLSDATTITEKDIDAALNGKASFQPKQSGFQLASTPDVKPVPATAAFQTVVVQPATNPFGPSKPLNN